MRHDSKEGTGCGDLLRGETSLKVGAIVGRVSRGFVKNLKSPAANLRQPRILRRSAYCHRMGRPPTSGRWWGG
jgi:hypothetical protein